MRTAQERYAHLKNGIEITRKEEIDNGKENTSPNNQAGHIAGSIKYHSLKQTLYGRQWLYLLHF